VVLGENIYRQGKGDAQGRIFGALLKRYAEEQAIKPTEEELAAFIARTEIAQTKIASKTQKDLAEVTQQLAEPDLAPEKRAQLEAQKSNLERFQKSQELITKASSEEAEQIKKVQRRIAEDFVGRWKVNKALYDQYGGRIIFQQAGPEPLDAYRDFLKAEEKRGSFKILDPQVEADFWRYFTDEKMHVFTEDKNLLTTPWWLKATPGE